MKNHKIHELHFGRQTHECTLRNGVHNLIGRFSTVGINIKQVHLHTCAGRPACKQTMRT